MKDKPIQVRFEVADEIPLTVVLPEHFKPSLERRFNPKFAIPTGNSLWVIDEPCIVCDVYYKRIDTSQLPCIFDCEGCPFFRFVAELRGDIMGERFIIVYQFGCLNWIKKIYPEFNYEKVRLYREHVEWYDKDNKEARQMLFELRKRAEQYIIWKKEVSNASDLAV